MLRPEELLAITDTLLPIFDDLNFLISQDRIRRAIRCLEQRGKGQKAWEKAVGKAAEEHYEALMIMLQSALRRIDAETQAIFEDAAVLSVGADIEVYKASGFVLTKPAPEQTVQTTTVPPVPAEPVSDSVETMRAEVLESLSEPMVDLMESAYQRTAGTIRNFTHTTADASQKHFIEAVDKAYLQVMSGEQSYTAAVKGAINELSAYQTKVVYPTGHVDTIETAVLRAVRAGVAKSCGDMSLQQMEEYGWDLIRVSAHLGARYGNGGENAGNHFWWQGKLYSRSGKDPNYPPFSQTGYGTGEGLCGWNCRHSFGPGDPNHNPWTLYDAEENKRVYDLSQKQRRREVAIRKSKLRLLELREGMDATGNAELKDALQTEYNRTALRLQKQNAGYKEFCRANDLPTYNDRLGVAKWNRSQAAKATSAAKRAKAK